MIHVDHLSKRFGSLTALNSVSFDIKGSTITGLLGPNGAGKSTILNIITGYTSRSAGAVEIDGYDPALQPMEVRRRIGYLPESPPLYDELTIDEYLRFVAALRGVPRRSRRKRIASIREAVGIDDMGRRVIGNLSKGYRQRVGVAQALIGDPPILILDEPTSGLDPVQIMEIRGLISSLSADKTVILSSHILSDIQAVCESIVIIHEGSVAAAGTPEEIARAGGDASAIRLRVDAPRASVESALRRRGELGEIRWISREDSNTPSELLIIPRDGVTESIIAAAIIEDGLPLIALHGRVLSLEELFLRTVTGGRV